MRKKNRPNLLPPTAPTIYKFSLLFILVFTLLLIVFSMGLILSTKPAFAVLVIFSFFQLVLCIVAARLARIGRQNFGLWFLLLAIWTSVPVYSLQVLSLGWFGLIVTAILSILIVEQSLEDRKSQRQVIIVSMIFSMASPVVDNLESSSRLPLSGLMLAAPGLLAAALVIVFIGALKDFQNYSLQTKLLVFFLGVSTVPLLILGLYNYQATQTGLTETANQALLAAAENTAKEIDDYFEGTLSTLQTETRLSALGQILKTTPEERTALLEAEALTTLTILENKDSQHILGYYLLDRQGDLVISYPPLAGTTQQFLGFDTETISFLRTAMLTDIPHISSIQFDNQSRKSSFYVATQVGTESGEPLGLLVAQYDVSLFQDIIDEQSGLGGEQSYAMLLDPNGMILSHGERPDFYMRSLDDLDIDTYSNLRYMQRIPDTRREDMSIHYSALAQELASNDEPGRAFAVASYDDPNSTDHAAIAAVESRPWDVLFIQPQSIFLAPIRSQGQIAIAIIGIFVVLVVASATSATQFLANPIVNLTGVAERFSSGNLETLAPAATTDEIGILGQALNDMAIRLREMISGLEEQVQERTAELERRANQIQVAAEVARDSSSETDLSNLLDDTVRLISDRFGFYHTGVFLIDENREYAALQAANSDDGKKMLANRHRLRVGEEGIVGYVTSIGKPRIALDVGEDAVHFRNPFLPQTRSEMCIPLIVSNRIIGALDVQSKREAAFDEQDIAVLEIVADQLGIAIQNASLLSDMERALREAEIASGRYTEEAWTEYTRSQHAVKGYKLDSLGIQTSDSIPELSLQALKSGEVVQMAAGDDEQKTSEVAIPIRLRNQVIGVINLAFDGSGADKLTLDIVSVINDRLAVALENARLLDETRQRANLERIAGDISNRIRSTLDIDTVLETTLREIQQTLGVDEIEARLGLLEPQQGRRPDPEIYTVETGGEG